MSLHPIADIDNVTVRPVRPRADRRELCEAAGQLAAALEPRMAS